MVSRHWGRPLMAGGLHIRCASWLWRHKMRYVVRLSRTVFFLSGGGLCDNGKDLLRSARIEESDYLLGSRRNEVGFREERGP